MQVNYLRNNLVVRPFMLYYCFTTDLLLPYCCFTNLQVNCIRKNLVTRQTGVEKYIYIRKKLKIHKEEPSCASTPV